MLPPVKLLTDSKGRSDLGNAKISGMDKELNLTPKQYSNVGSIFFVGYIVLQLPATLLVRKIGPPLQVCYTLGAFPHTVSNALILWD
jgi:fucose permease